MWETSVSLMKPWMCWTRVVCDLRVFGRFLRGQWTRSSLFRGNLLSFPATQRKPCRSGVAPRLCRCDRLTYGPCGSSASICRSETPETCSRCSWYPCLSLSLLLLLSKRLPRFRVTCTMAGSRACVSGSRVAALRDLWPSGRENASVCDCQTTKRSRLTTFCY